MVNAISKRSLKNLFEDLLKNFGRKCFLIKISTKFSEEVQPRPQIDLSQGPELFKLIGNIFSPFTI